MRSLSAYAQVARSKITIGSRRKTRQLRSFQHWTAVIAALVLIVIGAGALNIEARGFRFFTFRETGAGETGPGGGTDQQFLAREIPAPQASPNRLANHGGFTEPPVVLASAPLTYTVRPGDTLSSVASKIPASWMVLWYANRSEVPDPDLVSAGLVLRISGLPQLTTAIRTAAMAALPKPPPPPPPAPAPAPAVTAAPAEVSAGSFEQCVITRESGGNPDAQNPDSTASGLFGFLDTTWTDTTGLPGPARAYSVAVQTSGFWKLFDSAGMSPWDADGCPALFGG
jgi:LysM domain